MKNFNLIECMIFAFIIAILIGIGLPALGYANKQALKIKEDSQRQIERDSAQKVELEKNSIEADTQKLKDATIKDQNNFYTGDVYVYLDKANNQEYLIFHSNSTSSDVVVPRIKRENNK